MHTGSETDPRMDRHKHIITEAPNVIGGGGSFLFFNETRKDSVLDGQNKNQPLLCPFAYGIQIAINVVGGFNLII